LSKKSCGIFIEFGIVYKKGIKKINKERGTRKTYLKE